MNYLRFSQTKNGSYPVVCTREGGANTTPFQVAHFVLRNTPKNGSEKEAGKGEAKKGEGIFARLLCRAKHRGNIFQNR